MRYLSLTLLILFISAAQHITAQRVSCHDPSIFIDTITDSSAPLYYIYGSHLGRGYTTEESHYKNWTSFKAGEESTGTQNSLFADVSGNLVNFSEAYNTHAVTQVKDYGGNLVSYGNFNAHWWQSTGYTVAGNQWAPDVIYNKTMHKWCMYMALNGDKWCSSIVCFTSNSPEGPWIYQGPVIFSGFNHATSHVGYSATDDWKYTDFSIATGETSLPSRYAPSGSYGNFWPNNIDPCVFYDDDDNLWMSYGSWSGGIWIIRLNPENGLRDYTYRFPYQVNGVTTTPGAASSNCTSDPYFGKKIAGGYYVSGEASYIKKIGNYYFLFMSYGWLGSDGGYQIRIFRSKSPTGPFTDPYGTSAIYTGYRMNYSASMTDCRGMLLMGGYKWDTMPVAEICQGHNSAMTDTQGRSFVCYHTRFNDGTEGHQVRIHQLFLNEDGWLSAAPYEFHGETVTDTDIATRASISDSDIPGSYQFIRHQYFQDTASKAYETPSVISLNADGSITGSASGIWYRTANTDYITLEINGVSYKGVLINQTIDYTTTKTLCIAACSSSSGELTMTQEGFTRQQEIWCSKIAEKQDDATYYPVSTYKNLTSAFWINFSTENYTLSLGKTVGFQFYNYSDKVNNWDNWCLYGANSGPGSSGYTEYFGIRCDNWDNTPFNNTGCTSDFDWDTFKEDMDGSLVNISITYQADYSVNMTSTITTTTDKTYNYSYTNTLSDKPSNIMLFFVSENSYIDGSGCSYIETIRNHMEPSGTTIEQTLNLSGQRVGSNYKGIIISNGHKYIR